LGGTEGELFSGVSNPFAGLALGVLFTVLVQSSSTTTSTIVAVVGSGALSVEHAVPMILGANIGTTVTNTVVSIGHVRNTGEFQRAFAAATVHDFFNLCMVAIFLPLEIATRFLSRTAAWLSSVLRGTGGAEYESPIKSAVKEAHDAVKSLVASSGLEGKALATALLVVGIALTFLCLYWITRNMRQVMSGRIEAAMNRALESGGIVTLLVGILITVAVQSSSITTSLLVPMCAAGVMSLRSAFGVAMGANVGTTVTALLASLAQENPSALTIALVHVLFNTLGVGLVFPLEPVRRIPVRMAEGLALLVVRSKLWILAYVVGVFVALPALGWFLWRGTA
jgi:sodium-dependent phosphate cotransporter